jgi:hypothetical protein
VRRFIGCPPRCRRLRRIVIAIRSLRQLDIVGFGAGFGSRGLSESEHRFLLAGMTS